MYTKLGGIKPKGVSSPKHKVALLVDRLLPAHDESEVTGEGRSISLASVGKSVNMKDDTAADTTDGTFDTAVLVRSCEQLHRH